MPVFVFRGLAPMHYTSARDAADRPVGVVDPGDTRDLNEALDELWVPADGSAGESTGDVQQAGAPEDPAGASGTGVPAAAPEPVAPGPVPAPPAVIPAT